MARPREFDLDDAVAKATQAFLRHGYEGTSVCDLTEAMGIEKGSLYKAFTDKRSLYLEGLRRYLAAGTDNLQRRLGGHADALDAIRAFFTPSGQCESKAGATGCFAINAMAELAPHDEDVRAMLEAHWVRTTELLANTLKLGQLAGQVRADRPAAELALMLTRLLGGVAVFARKQCPKSPAPATIDPAIDAAIALLRP